MDLKEILMKIKESDKGDPKTVLLALEFLKLLSEGA